jgi:cation diffusion facilitator CzcD-associated flavoprotein CzcO
LPVELVSHTSDNAEPARFQGRKVLIVGAGQSALEYAALLTEAGAHVQLVVRAADVRWLRRHPRLHSVPTLAKILYAPAEIGPPALCRLAEAPDAFHFIPYRSRQSLTERCIRPAGSAWLRDRVVGKVGIITDATLREVSTSPGGVALSLSDGAKLEADHLRLATGYSVDVTRYSFLGPDVLAFLRRSDGFPHLSRRFESSVPGLYFLGAPAAGTFGPLMRFVAGSGFAANRVADAVTRQQGG